MIGWQIIIYARKYVLLFIIKANEDYATCLAAMIATIATDLIAVNTHSSKQEGSGSERYDLSVDDQFTPSSTKHPLAECDEQYLCCHRHQTDQQVTDGQVDYDSVQRLDIFTESWSIERRISRQQRRPSPAGRQPG